MNAFDPHRSFGFLLHDIARLMRRSFSRRMHSLGLTQTQWRALAHLARNEGIRQVALAEILEVQPISLARLIDRLQDAGWVERRPDPDDRRAFQLFLTQRARPMVDKMWEAALAIRAEAMAGLSANAQAQMIESLCTIKWNLMRMDKEGGAVPDDSAEVER